MTVETERTAPDITSETATKRRRRRASSADAGLATRLVAPTIILMILVIGYPIVKALIQSFQKDGSATINSDGTFSKGGGFAGFSNYTDWLFQRCAGKSCPPGLIHGQFYDAVFVTVLFTVVTVVLEVVLGMAFAVIMSKNFKGRALLRASVLVPWAIPTAVTAKLFYFMFAPDGIINHILGRTILWTDDKWPSIFAIVISDVWKTTPFIALLILAGLQVIPGDIYESARVDGASGMQAFIRITLPLVKPAVLVAVLFRVLDVLRMYDLPAILTQGGGGNGHATTTVSILVVREIQEGGYGSASALSTIIFLGIFAIAFALVKLFGINAVETQQKAVKK